MPDFWVVLVEPRFDGNIGSAARAMKNFGFSNLALVNPPTVPPDSSAEARAMSMHGRDILEKATVYNSFEEMAEDFDFMVATTAQSASDKNALRSPVFPEELSSAYGSDSKVGILFGREDKGLHNEEIGACDLTVTIPASREYPTLNLSQSVAIILYEISRVGMRSDIKRVKKFRGVDKKQKDLLLVKFDEVVELIYEHDYEKRIIKRTFRNLIGRAFIAKREAFSLMGLMRKMKRGVTGK